jgi:hypothetical protein
VPWWGAAIGAGGGLGVTFILLGLGIVGRDESMGWMGTICAGLIAVPIGLGFLAAAAMGLLSGGPELLRQWRTVRRLARDPGAVDGWSSVEQTIGTTTEQWIHLHLRDGSRAAIKVLDGFEGLPEWLARTTNVTNPAEPGETGPRSEA